MPPMHPQETVAKERLDFPCFLCSPEHNKIHHKFVQPKNYLETIHGVLMHDKEKVSTTCILFTICLQCTTLVVGW